MPVLSQWLYRGDSDIFLQPRTSGYELPMRLGGYVIHGNAEDTLEACLSSLASVCDEVLAIDTGATDGSNEIVRSMGLRSHTIKWQGYGAARAFAASQLQAFDYIFFLDSDESLTSESIASLRRWKESGPGADLYALTLNDWVELPNRRFLYRSERKRRVVRPSAASWKPSMIVHEALSGGTAPLIDASIEHRFVVSLDRRESKDERYALLWALRAFSEGRRAKPVWPQRIAHVFRDAIFKGAAFRGGVTGLRVAWRVSRSHSRKHALLKEISAGAHAELSKALREERLEDLFRSLPDASTS